VRRLALLGTVLLAACGGSTALPPYAPPAVAPNAGVAVDRLDGAASCRVSADGRVWYTVPAGAFAPLDVAQSACSGVLSAQTEPVPAWARPSGPTKAVFAAVSLVGSPGDGPVQPLAAVAHAAGVPLTYLVDRPWSGADAATYDAEHALGDDVQVSPDLVAPARAAWSWFSPSVAVLGAGRERDVAGTLAAGVGAFWGIAWNSDGVDGTADRGTPWGIYCADPASYKRPAPGGSCALAGVEWTARDLTMAYLSDREDAYSTDPDDLRLRAGLMPAAAAGYVRGIVDAYAAAGATTPLLVVAQEEASEFAAQAAADAPIESALYAQAKLDGMTVTTLARAVALLRAPAAEARVVAFPALPASGRYGPATIDAHDTHVGLTFRAGETMPSRVFAFDRATTSRYDVPVPQLAASEMPSLVGVTAAAGVLTLRFQAPVATRFGVAFWSDPATMRWTSPNVVPAGRAGAVAFFDLAAGTSTVTLGCGACTSTTFAYST